MVSTLLPLSVISGGWEVAASGQYLMSCADDCSANFITTVHRLFCNCMTEKCVNAIGKGGGVRLPWGGVQVYHF